jgi:predicted metal-dependent phosphoesterase TrpH
MPTAPALLCELHAHTTWSDGALTPLELVDLYGRRGFDVLCVTDHTLPGGGELVHAENHGAYLEAIDEAAAAARERYGMLVLPGLELTCEDGDPETAAHALAVGLRSFVAAAPDPLEPMLQARAAGAAIIACHPHAERDDPWPGRTTRRFWREHERLAGAVDRWELINRSQVFEWVAGEGLPAVANGDFHRPQHLSSWKTLLPCAAEEAAVVEHLRSGRPAYIVRVDGAGRARTGPP